MSLDSAPQDTARPCSMSASSPRDETAVLSSVVSTCSDQRSSSLLAAVEQLCCGVDRDEQWRALDGWLRPFETDRASYRNTVRHARPVMVSLDGELWRMLMDRLSVQGALDVMLLFGCVPLPATEDEDVAQWVQSCYQDGGSGGGGDGEDGEPPASARFRVLMQDQPTKSVTFFDDVYQNNVALSSSSTEPPQSQSQWQNNEDASRVRELENEVKELTRQLRLMKSREVMTLSTAAAAPPAAAMTTSSALNVSGAGALLSSSSSTTAGHASSCAAGGGGGPTHPPPSQQAGDGANPTNTTPLAQTGVVASSLLLHNHPPLNNTTRSSTLSPGGGSASASHHAPLSSSAASNAAMAAVSGPPIPQLMQPQGSSLVASTTGGSIVCLPLNYLDPDGAPYVVGLQTHTSGLQLVPCSIVEHRFVLFVAPSHPRGSVAVSVLCSQDGGLRRYTKAAWLEYRPPQDTRTVLSYHAVNQLMQEVPLPSSATLADPSENATTDYEEAISNPDDMALLMEDAASENGSVATSWATTTTTNLAARTAAGEPRQHLPLTREMLEMFEPYSVFGGPPGPLVPSDSHREEGSALRISVPPSECSEMVDGMSAAGGLLLSGGGGGGALRAASASLNMDGVSISVASIPSLSDITPATGLTASQSSHAGGGGAGSAHEGGLGHRVPLQQPSRRSSARSDPGPGNRRRRSEASATRVPPVGAGGGGHRNGQIWQPRRDRGGAIGDTSTNTTGTAANASTRAMEGSPPPLRGIHKIAAASSPSEVSSSSTDNMS